MLNTNVYLVIFQTRYAISATNAKVPLDIAKFLPTVTFFFWKYSTPAPIPRPMNNRQLSVAMADAGRETAVMWSILVNG